MDYILLIYSLGWMLIRPLKRLFCCLKRKKQREGVLELRKEMKFCKKYQEYMEEQEKELPRVGFKKLKKILKKCRRHNNFQSRNGDHHSRDVVVDGGVNLHPNMGSSSCPHHCPVCDGTFFPSLLKEMSEVVGCFNKRAEKLLGLHLASGFRKYVIWFKTKLQRNHIGLIQEGKDLVTYAMINAVAIRKILKKYDKIHYSKQGQAFRSKAQSMHIEILKSPWLCELIAFHINLKETKNAKRTIPGFFDDCSLNFDGGKPSLSFALFDSVKLEIDLTCSICLDTVFDPVSLTCSHIFCYMCACSAASVTIVDGLNAAEPKQNCPLCRAAGVYAGAVHLDELNILLSRRCPEYWNLRLQTERVERVRQAKEHWESQCRAFIGV